MAKKMPSLCLYLELLSCAKEGCPYAAEVAGINGRYYNEKELHQLAPAAQDQALAQAVWELSLALMNGR